MFILTSCLIALNVAVGLSSTEDKGQELDPEVKRFAAIYDKAVRADWLKDRLEDVVREVARDAKLGKAETSQLRAAIPAALNNFRSEKARSWAAAHSVQLVNAECHSLQSTTSLVEVSNAWHEAMRATLDDSSWVAWQGVAAERGKELREQLKRADTVRRMRLRWLQSHPRPGRSFSLLAARTQPNQPFLGAILGRDVGTLETTPESVFEQAKRDAYSYVEQLKRRTRLEYAYKLAAMNLACDLTPSQEVRLKLAIKGVVTKRHGRAQAQADRLAEHLKNPQPKDPLWKKTLGSALAELSSVSETDSHLVFWYRACERTLTEQQVASIPPEVRPARPQEAARQ